MKKRFLVFARNQKSGAFELHKHPVFTGDACYDLNQEQSIQIDEENNVREFTSPGEVVAALQDYFRSVPDAKAPGEFYILESNVLNFPSAKKSKPKTK